MLGLFGRKTPEEPTLLAKETAKYGGSGFDPTGLERAAKAAKAIDASANARLAFDVIQAREATKRLEHGTRQAAYEMQARQYEMQSVGKEGQEARETLAAQTAHANKQAEYADQLERRRYAANLGAQRDARGAELKRHEASLARQEELRRRTLRYESELREKTELKRAEAEATARARTERETHDLSLDRMRAEMAERRETLLKSIGVSFETAGAGLQAFLGDREQMTRAVAIASSLALGVYGARATARVAGDHAAARLGRPSLVRETSRASALDVATPAGWKRLLARGGSGDALEGVVLEPVLAKRLAHVAASTKNTRANAAPFRHVLLHGPPGTGKTLFAKKLARASGLDYAILTGGDVAPLGRDAVTEIHRLFDWAATSNRGLLLFIDEADAFLRSRREATSEDLRNAFNAFLYRTGEPSRDVMLVYASNAAEDFDWAINDRIDEMVRFSLPGTEERARMLRQYLDEYFQLQEVADAKVEAAVRATEGFSGREIHKLVVAWKAAASAEAGGDLDEATRAEVLEAHVAQRAVKSGWNAAAAL